jgi:hypothetical protein
MQTFTITSDTNDDTQTLTLLITPAYAQANCSFDITDFTDDDDDDIENDSIDDNGNIKLFLHFYENENPYLAFNDHFNDNDEIIEYFGNEIFDAIIALRPTNTITYY